MSAYFYSEIIEDSTTKPMLDGLADFANSQMKPVFVINKPLGTSYEYEYNEAAVILVPKHKIIVVNWGEDKEAFEDFYYEFIEDLGHISDKYKYKEVIGRSRKWKDSIFRTIELNELTDINKILNECILANPEGARLSQLIVSLLTGSINDISKVGKEIPNDILDAVKRRIVLYDAKQTDFIFRKFNK